MRKSLRNSLHTSVYAYVSAVVMRFARRSTRAMSRMFEVEQEVLQITAAHVENTQVTFLLSFIVHPSVCNYIIPCTALFLFKFTLTFLIAIYENWFRLLTHLFSFTLYEPFRTA